MRLGLGVLGLTALLAIAVAPLLTPVERGDGLRVAFEPRWALSAEAEALRGSTTLGELVELGVPLESLLRELGLPAGTPADERLGRLGRVYGFTLTEVRDLVDADR